MSIFSSLLNPSAIPAVRSLEACTDFHSTVLPYQYQLSTLPYKLLDAGLNTDALLKVYVETNPLIFAFAFALAISPIFLVVSEINKNYSQVDRCWSLLPTFYIAHYFAWSRLSGVPIQYIDVILAFGITWSTRLTFNYWRKGGYQIGSEDYRWEIVKGKVHPALFFIFNVTFICFGQSILLFLVTTPLYIFLLTTQTPAGQNTTIYDTAFASTLFFLVVIEYIADGQQWTYYTARDSYHSTAKAPAPYTVAELERGFNTRGLWAHSRHPNFAAEQSIWVTLYAWSCYRSGVYYNWTGVGAASYLALFQGSTWLTEVISAGKYHEYRDYQIRVGMFFPSLTSFWAGPTGGEDAQVKPEVRKAIREANKRK